MTLTIEIARSVETEEIRKVIAECNVYDGEGKIVRQCSRSPFEFPAGTTDDEIVQALRYGDYAQYFVTEQDEL